MEDWMPARNGNVAALFVAEKGMRRQGWFRPGTRILIGLALLVGALLAAEVCAAREQAASATEVQRLRQEVSELQASVKRLEALLTGRAANPAVASASSTADAAQPNPVTPVQPNSEAANGGTKSKEQSAANA